MKRNNLFVLSVLLLLCGRVCAQEEATTDSVIVMGVVVDHLTNEPQPYSLLHFIRNADTATVRCDEEGYFVSKQQVGDYTLSVTLEGKQVYQADLVLNDNAALHIAVITDSFSFRRLAPVEVLALKHLLGTQLIDSPSDIRLWNMTYRKGGGDHSSSVSISPDMEPEWDELDDDEEHGVLRLLLPLGIPGKAYKYYLSSFGLNVSPYNSEMKNELLSIGRILDTKRPAPADTTQRKQ